MEQELEIIILGGEEEEDIEYVIINNAIRDEVRMHVERIFSLDVYSDDDSVKNFRFLKADILRLANSLRLPELVRTPTRNCTSGTTALCMVLRRLAYPNRLNDLEHMFYLSAQSMSQIINFTMAIILQNFGHLLDDLGQLPWLTRNKLEQYAQAIRDKGGAVQNCWGFIDGTVRPICRPTVEQENYYSGHKRCHCVKYQSVLCPDGIISSLKGAYPGRRHDAAIFRESNLYNQLELNVVWGEDKFVLYGDQAYGLAELLLCPYAGRQADLPPYQANFNRSMAMLRISVEWGFHKITRDFAFLDLKKKQKFLLQDLECMYKVSVILTNCHTCLYGSQTSSYFNIMPPQLDEYLGI